MNAMPQVFNFRTPEMPEVAPMPTCQHRVDNGNLLLNRPRLGIDAEDISGSLVRTLERPRAREFWFEMSIPDRGGKGGP